MSAVKKNKLTCRYNHEHVLACYSFVKGKSGINKPIICKRCGKRVGYITIKPRFKFKMIMWIFIGALITQIISEVIGRFIFGDYKI